MVRTSQLLVSVHVDDDLSVRLIQYETGRCALDIGGVWFHGTLEQLQRIASRVGELTVKASCERGPAGRVAWKVGDQP